MTLLSIFFVLVIEQLRAAPRERVEVILAGYTDFIEGHFNGGERRHGIAAWFVGVGLPTVLVLFARFGLEQVHPLLALILDVGVLYIVMGFRQFSHHFTDIQLALRMGELDRARQLLFNWRGRDASRLGSAAIARLAIEQGILSSHRHVFAPLFWFILLGPAGAILYRLSLFMTLRWSEGTGALAHHGEFGRFSSQAFLGLDWLPVKLTAITFAIVGDFEDAVFCWRNQAEQWPDPASGILLASGAGALGVCLGAPVPESGGGLDERPEIGIGEEADVEHLQSAIGLVWRALVLSLLVLALLTVANWVGA